MIRLPRLDWPAMRSRVPKLLALAVVCAAALAFAAPALAVPHVEGTFDVSATGANNLKLAEGSDGNMWLTLEGGTKEIARITPGGEVKEFELGGEKNLGGIVTGPEGNLFVVVEKGVVRFSPTNPEGTLKAFEVSPAIKGFSPIVRGPNGQLWIATEKTVLHFAASNPAGGAVESPVAELTPHDIDLAGSLIVVAAGNIGNILTFNATGTAPETPGKVAFVNNPEKTSQGVAGTPGGQFAFSESDGEEGLGLDTPPSPATAELRKVGDPFGVALGVDRAYYFAMFGDKNVRRLVPGSPSTAIEGFPKGFGGRQISAGPGNTMWVALEDPETAKVKVSRIAGLEPPVTPAPGPIPVAPVPPVVKPALPTTKLGSKPKKVVKITGATAQVKFGFSSTTAGARFECALGHRVKPKGKKARFVGQSFKACGSPKKYSLGPGRYRFQVRAVAGGARDSSPAAFGFKVVRTNR
jgi:hypothetical protein